MGQPAGCQQNTSVCRQCAVRCSPAHLPVPHQSRHRPHTAVNHLNRSIKRSGTFRVARNWFIAVPLAGYLLKCIIYMSRYCFLLRAKRLQSSLLCLCCSALINCYIEYKKKVYFTIRLVYFQYVCQKLTDTTHFIGQL